MIKILKYKKLRLVSIFAILFSIFTFWYRSNHQMTNADNLTYILTTSKEPISFNHLESDNLSKQTYMAALIGTLIKNDDQVRYSPYLASSWSTDDFIHWNFNFRKNIFTEDGEEITPVRFKKSIENVIKIYHQIRPSLPIIEEIEGYSDFVGGVSPELKGIRANTEVLTLKFTKPINSGVLEFLSMPYYGYYSQKNFKDGKWANDLKIYSSGSHVVDSINEVEKKVILKKRHDWFSFSKNSVEKIEIIQIPLEQAFLYQGPKIIQTNSNVDFEKINKLHLNYIIGVPDMMIGFSLNIKEGFFADSSNRKLFLKKIRGAQKNIKLENEGLIFSEYFYPAFQSEVQKNDQVEKYKLVNKKIVVLCPNSASPRRPAYLKSIIEDAIKDSGIDLEFKSSIPATQIKKMNADIKIFAVAIGGGFEHWLTKMMFCSDLGVRLPDPENRICNLVEKYDGLNWNINEFAKEFNDILYDQAATIPIFHNSHKWIVDGVDVELSPISLIPRFDLMKLK